MLLQVVFLLFLFFSFFFLFSLSLSLSLSSNHFALPGERRKRRRGCCPSLSQFSAFPLVFLRLLSPRDRACRSEPRTNFSGSARRADKEGEAAASTFAERPRRFDGGNLSLSLSLSSSLLSWNNKDVEPRPGLLHRGAVPLRRRGRRWEGPLGVCGRGCGRVSDCFFRFLSMGKSDLGAKTDFFLSTSRSFLTSFLSFLFF